MAAGFISLFPVHTPLALTELQTRAISEGLHSQPEAKIVNAIKSMYQLYTHKIFLVNNSAHILSLSEQPNQRIGLELCRKIIKDI